MTQATEPWTVGRLLEWTAGFFARKGVDSPRLSAELLLAHVMGVPRIKLYTDYQSVLPDAKLSAYRDLVKRGGEHEPIAYLTGRAHFFNLEFEVTRDVLIPRPDTETLVENIVQLARNQGGFESPRLLDLCTGSGCVGAAVASRLKSATVVATDISEAALAVARANFQRLGVAERVTVLQGDLYGAIASTVEAQPFDLIVSNPPYIPTGALAGLDRNVKDFEPRLALDGGADGLSFHRRILDGAADRLRPGGRLYLEIQFDKGMAALELAAQYDALDDVRILKDYGGRDRVLTARRT